MDVESQKSTAIATMGNGFRGFCFEGGTMNKPTDEEQTRCAEDDIDVWRTIGAWSADNRSELNGLYGDLRTRCAYGKHQGRPLLCVPVKYLDGQFHSMDDGVFKFIVERILRSPIVARMYRSGCMDKSVGEYVYHVPWKFDDPPDCGNGSVSVGGADSVSVPSA
jgi:hypothetical protein